MNWISLYKFFGPYIMLLGMLLVLLSMDLVVSANPILLLSKLPIILVGLVALTLKILQRRKSNV